MAHGKTTVLPQHAQNEGEADLLEEIAEVEHDLEHMRTLGKKGSLATPEDHILLLEEAAQEAKQYD